jgi:hypothetical protein
MRASASVFFDIGALTSIAVINKDFPDFGLFVRN